LLFLPFFLRSKMGAKYLFGGGGGEISESTEW